MASAVTKPPTQEEIQAQILAALVALTGRTIKDEEVDFKGKRIVLPEGTTLRENIEFLERLEVEYEEFTEFSREFTFKLWDVAYATTQALRQAFGSMRHTAKSFLEPPKLIDIPCGPNETVQVPFGAFVVPALPNVRFSVEKVHNEKYGWVGAVTAQGPKKHKIHIESIFDLVEKQLKDNSLYRGKAFTDDEKPEFIDVDAINPAKIVYSHEVTKQLEANVYARFDFPEEMTENDIPFKCAILLEGQFGVGKTEALNLIAKRAVAKDITFIKVKSGGDLMQAMATARMYSPAVVAFEDVDAVAGADNETERIQQVLEAFDGQQAKLNPVMVLITTNYVDTLHKGMVRPGRIDAVIHIGAPDAEGIRKLVEARAKPGLLANDVEWDAVAEAMVDYFPSFVVEATSRAIRYAVVRIGGSLSDGDLRTEDLVSAAIELRPQWLLHDGASTGTVRPTLDQAVMDTVRRAVGHELAEDEGGELSTLVEVEGEKTRQVVMKRTTALARHVSDEAATERKHTTDEADRVIEQS